MCILVFLYVYIVTMTLPFSRALGQNAQEEKMKFYAFSITDIS